MLKKKGKKREKKNHCHSTDQTICNHYIIKNQDCFPVGLNSWDSFVLLFFTTKGLPRRLREGRIGRVGEEDRFVQGQTRLYSFKLSCRMVSLTAAKTNRIFSVSVAQVK